MSAELSRAASLMTGEYTVTVSGVDLEVDSGTATVEARKAKSIEITTEYVPVGTNEKVKFVAKDQYGIDMELAVNKFAWNVTNATNGVRTATTVNTASTDKYLEINNSGGGATNPEVGDLLRITAVLLDDATVSTVSEVKVENVYISEITLEQPKLPANTERLTQNAGYVELPYTLSDNFGQTVKFTEAKLTNDNNATVNGIQFITSDATIIPVVSGGADNIKVNATTGKLEVKVLNKAGKVTLSAINTNTGYVNSIQIEVFKTAEATSVEFGELVKPLVAGDAAGTAKLPVTFYDQFGAAIKETTAANQTIATFGAGFSVTVIQNTGTGQTLVPSAAVTSDGKYITFNDNAVVKGTYTVTLMNSKSGTTFSTQLTVNESRIPATLEVATAPSSILSQSATTSVKLVVKDQYGDKITTDMIGDNYAVVYSKSPGNDTHIATPAHGAFTFLTIDNVTDQTISIAAAAAGDGNVTLKYQLAKLNAGNTAIEDVLDVKEFALTVADPSTAIVSYGAKALKGFYAVGTGSKAPITIVSNAHAAGNYDQTISVYGLNTAGQQIALAAADKAGFVYVSQNPVLASVDSSGVVRGLKAGTTAVDVYEDNTMAKKIATVAVTIDDAKPEIASISVPADFTMAASATAAKKITIKDQYDVNWVNKVIVNTKLLSEDSSGIVVVSSNTTSVPLANIVVTGNGEITVTATATTGVSVITIASGEFVKQFKVTVE